MAATVRQLSFAAGELAEKLHSRTDLELYRKGLKVCRNFFPTLEGQLVSRPGSTFVHETKGSAIAHGVPFSAANTKVRLLPFVFSLGQTYVLEFGNQYVRFHTNGGTVESSPGVPYEIASPYSFSDLPRLQFAQVGNIMVLTHPSYDAYVLERLSHLSWTLTAQSYTPPVWPGLPYIEPRLNTMTWAGYSGFMSNPMIENTADFAGDATHPVREWIYAVTVDGQNKKSGKLFESQPIVVTQKWDGVDTYPVPSPSIVDLADHFVALYPDRKVTISAQRLSIGTAPDFIVLGINIYRGRARDFYGLVGRVLNSKFVDVGDAPNFVLQPPIGTHPFRVFDSNGAVLRIEKPMAVCFSDDRLVYGGAWDNDKLIRVGTLFYSQQSQWDRFDKYKIPFDQMSMELELALDTRQEIRTLFRHQKLLIGTDAAVHSICGPDGRSLNATDPPDRRIEAHIGCAHLRMLNVRGTVLFAEGAQDDSILGPSYGLAVHSLRFQDSYSEYKNVNLSSQASHLFYGDDGGSLRMITDWAYAAKPWQLVYLVRRDGQMLTLTYHTESGSIGWARHDTDGAYENVCTVPEGAEDAVYVVANRTINGETRRYIERLTTRARLGGPAFSGLGSLSQAPDDICLDSAKSYYGAATTHLTGLDHLEGKEVWVIGPNKAPQGSFVVTGGAINLANGSANVTAPLVGDKLLVYVGLLYRPEMQTLAVGGEPEKQKTLKGLVLEVKDTRGCQVGFDLDHLRDVKQLRPSTGYSPIPNETRKLVVQTTGTWDTDATAALRQNLPLPCTITGLTRIIETGGAP